MGSSIQPGYIQNNGNIQRQRCKKSWFTTAGEALQGTGKENNPPLITTEEVKTAARKLKNGKAPGLDGVPAKAVKELAKMKPEISRDMLNQ